MASIGPGQIAPPIRLGALTLPGRAILAPMAGVTDLGMRRAAQRFGASLTVSEMVVGDQLARGEAESLVRAAGTGLSPLVVQIAGCRAEALADGARAAEAAGAVAIDINMGCPAKKVTGGLAGSALMRDLDVATRLIAATVAAVRVPVTVKMRLGWDHESLNAADLARRAEGEGVALVTVHGRTRQQFYGDKADWVAVAEVKRAVSIPVVVNGDCSSPADAAEMLRLSGADAVMIGRAAIGRPWLIGQIGAYLRTGVPAPEPSLAERREAALDHFDTVLSLFGAHKGNRHVRKHLVAYSDHASAGHAPDSAEGAGGGRDPVGHGDERRPGPNAPAARRDLRPRPRAGPRGVTVRPETMRDSGFAQAGEVINLLPHAVLVVETDGIVAEANSAAESFFDMSRAMLKRHHLSDLVPFASPLLALIDQCVTRGAPLNEYRVDLGNPKLGPDRVVDIHVSPMGDRKGRPDECCCCRNGQLPTSSTGS